MSDNKRFSFEFFPPKTDVGREKLETVRKELNQLGPDFFSVTYGAGGSTRDNTKDIVLTMTEEGISTAPHLSFGGDDEASMLELITEYKNAGINRIVSLRGDMPSGMGAQRLIYAEELVRFIREHTGDHFHLEVAAYPEIHPDSRSVEADLAFFKAKVDAGANSAITQYFYNAEAYFRFIDACDKLAISIPIVPGIMPITNYQTLVRFSDTCGADIPRWIRKHLESYQDDPESLKAFGEDVVTRLCQQLLDAGAPGLHFYTLNQSGPTLKLWRNLGL